MFERADLPFLLAVLLANACTTAAPPDTSAPSTEAGRASAVAERDAAGGAQDAADGAGSTAPSQDAATAPDASTIADASAVTDAGAVSDPDAAADAMTAAGDPICPEQGGDYAMPGPYQVATVAVALPVAAGSQRSGAATIFHPTPLEEGCAHPIVAWGNGTGVFGTEPYAFYHERAASWGIVVIAPHDDLVADDGGLQRAGIEYLLQQNRDPSSVFYRRLSARVGTAGHAQGAFAAAQATKHTAVVAAVAIDGPIAPAAEVALLCLTGTNGFQECVSSVNAASAPAFVASWQGGDHIITPTSSGFAAMNPGTYQFMRLYTAWFRCFLAADATACALFEGGDACGLCREQNAGWHELRARNF